MDGNKVKSARIVLGQVAPIPWIAWEPNKRSSAKLSRPKPRWPPPTRRSPRPRPLSHNKYKITLTKVAVKRAIFKAAGQNSGGAA